MINIQPIEKLNASDGQTLSVHSIFYTIQGEGPFCGCPAVFIRLAGCNLQCPNCDTEYTQGRTEQSLPLILKIIHEQLEGVVAGNCDRLVVITGGEPLRQNIAPLIKILQGMGFVVQIETNGTLPAQDLRDAVIVCSPKAGKVHNSIRDSVHYWKYVLDHNNVNPDDGLPILVLNHSAEPQVFRPPAKARIYLQPMDANNIEDNAKNIAVCIASCMRFGYTLQLQTHKLIGMP